MGGMSLTPGQVVWCWLDPAEGQEQGGRRPCVVVSSNDYSDAISHLVIVVPCTSRDRGWGNHVLLTGPTGLTRPTFAMTEQPRTVSVARIAAISGHVDDHCLARLCRWVSTWIHAA